MSRCGTQFREPCLSELDKQTLTDLERLAKRLQWQADRINEAIAYCKRNETIEGIGDMVAMAFNAQQHTPQYGGGGGLPEGKYKVVIVNTYAEDTKDNFGNVKGGYLAFEITPVEGPQSGVKQTDRINLHHTNPKVVEIANKQLSAYCHVLNKFQFQDTQELCNIPFMVEIGLQKEPNPNGYTEVKAIFDVNGNEPGKAGNGPQANQNPQGGQQQQPNIPNQAAGDVQPQGQWGGNNNGGQQPNNQGQQTPIDNNVAMPNQQQQPNQQPQGGWGGGGQPQDQQGQQQPQNQQQPQDNGGGQQWGQNQQAQQPSWGQR